MNEFIQAFSKLSPEGWLTIGFVMLPLMLWLIRIWLLENSDLAQEKSSLESIRPLTKAATEDEFLESEDIDQFAEKLKNVPATSLVKRVTLAIINARMINNPDIEAIMGLLLSREATRFSAVRAIPNLLMLAGLLGTVFGLAASVGGLSSQIAQSIQQGNIELLSKSLAKTLGQMQGAFGATLWGILLSGISALLLGAISSTRAKFASELQDFVLVDLVPAVFPRSTGAQLEMQRKLLKQSNASVQQLKNVLEETSHNLEKVLGSAGTRVQETLVQLGDVSQKALQTFQLVTKSVDTFGNALQVGAQTLATAQEQNTKTFANSSDNLATQLSGQVRKIDEFQQNFIGGSQKILERIDNVSSGLNMTVSAFRDEGTKQTALSTQMLDRLEQRFERLEKTLFTGQEANTQILTNASNQFIQQFGEKFFETTQVQKSMIQNTKNILEKVNGMLIQSNRLIVQLHDQKQSTLLDTEPDAVDLKNLTDAVVDEVSP